ncbi:kinase-like domain-containing protein [Gigaspora rosea]|uniref:Kinase-like domain-containing protein n=1 Tax=Gigaspora rosea TaxID=44941 RepID=A0A397UBF4_9GLOM|nr:kinase-like domain-containing protein [Gigaspora rosea]
MNGQKLCEIGWKYQFGIGVENNLQKAFKYYKESADAGNGQGLFQVAEFYHLGIHIKKSKSKAFKYFKKSAETGNSMGIFKTATCYYYGYGVKKNSVNFKEWLEKIDENVQFLDRGWTSENKDIDDCMKSIQLKINNYEYMIEWIPFNKFANIKKIGEGGFSAVYSATWLDGMRKIHIKRDRSPIIVALKTIEESSLIEIKHHMKFNAYNGNSELLRMYGLTRKEEEYMLAFQCANNGSLFSYLRKNFQTLDWENKLEILKNISSDLQQIHKTGLIHADFHSGNILQHNMSSYVSDLGLSRKQDETLGEIYGVLPYVAPEVLQREPLTQAADIYGFGIIMTEISTGQRPFDGRPFDIKLSLEICNGLRPELSPETPKCYIELAKQCMNSDPKKRPTAEYIYNEILQWLYYDKAIVNQFSIADTLKHKIWPSKHSDQMYTSKKINTREITEKLSKLVLSNSLDDMEIPNDY